MTRSVGERVDGFALIGDYGVLSDGRSAALVAADGDIDWFAAPRMDSPPLCATLLDSSSGGVISLCPEVPYRCSQQYVPDSMTLQTTFECDEGSVAVTDVLNLGFSGPLPWAELARRVDVLAGEVPMRWQVSPGSRFGWSQPWIQERSDKPVLRAGDAQVAVITDGLGSCEFGDGRVFGTTTMRAGDRGLLAVVVNARGPLPLPDPMQIQSRLDATTERWQRWSAGVAYQGPHADEVRRSALILKALTVLPQSGMAAAMTTSLPEQVGGSRNFDYRFGWVRDASFAVDAMSELGLSEEVHASVSWLLDAVAHTAPHIRPMYTLDGEPASAEMSTVESLGGHRDSPPVQVGNSAASQRQLGAYGDLLDAVWRIVAGGGRIDDAHAQMLAGMADHVCDLWRGTDAGIWELGQLRHYTISKIGCWVALDRAVRLAESGRLASMHVGRWRSERGAIRDWIDEHCWSEAERSYAFYAGTDDLDAAVLLAARTGFLAGDDPRLASTIAAIRNRLSAGGPLLYRYTEVAGDEGAFLACTFWLIEAMSMAGQRDEAAALFQQACGCAGRTGIYSEEIDPVSRELRGNVPQGLSHLAFIGAATALQKAQ